MKFYKFHGSGKGERSSRGWWAWSPSPCLLPRDGARREEWLSSLAVAIVSVPRWAQPQHNQLGWPGTALVLCQPPEHQGKQQKQAGEHGGEGKERWILTCFGDLKSPWRLQKVVCLYQWERKQGARGTAIPTVHSLFGKSCFSPWPVPTLHLHRYPWKRRT